MSDLNWWLMALAFLVGLVLTFALMIRRVKREVPVYATAGAGAVGGAAAAAEAVGGAAGAKVAGAKVAGGSGGATLAGDATAAMPAVGSVDIDEPFGAGSIRVPAAAVGPSGYSVKGNEDSMLYHTAESPSYKQTIAELWFRDVETAERAGFSRWDSAGGAAAAGAVAAGAGAAGAVSAAKLADTSPTSPTSAAPGATVEDEPFGAGSIRVEGTATAPTGYSVKGNEDSMLYHTAESPSYKQTIAEVWFRDVESAERAGFNRWDSGKSQRGKR